MEKDKRLIACPFLLSALNENSADDCAGRSLAWICQVLLKVAIRRPSRRNYLPISSSLHDYDGCCLVSRLSIASSAPYTSVSTSSGLA